MTRGSSCHLCCHLRVSSAVRVAFHCSHVAFAPQCGRLSTAVRVSIAVTDRPMIFTATAKYVRMLINGPPSCVESLIARLLQTRTLKRDFFLCCLRREAMHVGVQIPLQTLKRDLLLCYCHLYDPAFPHRSWPLCERCLFFTAFWRIDTSFLSLQPIILAGCAPREGGYTVPTGVPLAVHYQAFKSP
jgi:hypothetical protein